MGNEGRQGVRRVRHPGPVGLVNKDLGFYAGRNGAPLETCKQRHDLSF